MRPEIHIANLPVTVSSDLLNVLWFHMAEHQQALNVVSGITYNFRDPDYSPEYGGYHPVEIRLDKRGNVWHFAYVTDFAYVGVGAYAELVKELDFDFNCQVFSHNAFGLLSEKSLNEWFQLWQENFLNYYAQQSYTVSVSFD